MGHPSNQSHFATVPRAEIPRAKFKRDNNLHTTIDAGYLYPIYVDEVLPGDTHMLRENIFGRLATPIKPIMDNMYLDTFYFFVPSRLVWSNWKKFMGEKTNPGDSTTYTVPQIVLNNFAVGTIFDYYGLVPSIAQNVSVSALPLRCYPLIWNEWFRDQNLQDSHTFSNDDGPDLQAEYTLLKRGKRHDYFTSCLPSPQRGTAVSLPLGVRADVLGIDPSSTSVTASITTKHQGTFTHGYASSGASNLTMKATSANGPLDVYADLTTATSATINDIREAFQVQRLYERDNRGGTRYTEILRAHFGVVSPDQRIQRPEYLGGSSTRIGVSPVANTSDTASAKQGDLAGIGTVVAGGRGFTFSSTEHGYILGLVSLRADLNYQQGTNRMWSRSTKLDYYWPALAHLGEQAVLMKEIYTTGLAADANVFGYQEAWSEYKYKPNLVTGKFRSVDAGSLDVWHLAQDFASAPALNSTFIQENPPMSRVIAVSTEPHMLLDAYFDVDCVRPMPLYSVPGLVDHF